jgi:hypothetical protein
MLSANGRYHGTGGMLAVAKGNYRPNEVSVPAKIVLSLGVPKADAATVRNGRRGQQRMKIRIHC